MTAAPQTLIVGNWKMNGLTADLDEAIFLARELGPTGPRVALCPPTTLIERMSKAIAGSRVELGGQDCSPHQSGPYTGDVSAVMLADAGAALVILGHSERRTLHGETDADVAAKALASTAAGLEPIICVGESLGQRKAGRAVEVVSAQIAASVPAQLADQPFAIAYEPVWAIGTGLTPSTQDIDAMHAAIRAGLREKFGAAGERPPILYGGSVKPANAAEILAVAEVGGALVGGASLLAADFLAIVRAA